MFTKHLTWISFLGVILCCMDRSSASRGGDWPWASLRSRPQPKPVDINFHAYCNKRQTGVSFQCANDCNYCGMCICKNKRVTLGPGARCSRQMCLPEDQVVNIANRADSRKFCNRHPIGFDKFKCRNDCNKCSYCYCAEHGGVVGQCTKIGCFYDAPRRVFKHYK